MNLKTRSTTLKRFLAGLQALCLCALLFTQLGATDPDARFADLGHKMICACGCNQVLLECNHIGCPVSPGMRDELSAGVARGDSDSLVLQSFVQKYGATVLAAPTTQGFNLVAWVVPFALFGLAFIGTALLIRNWKLRSASLPAAHPALASNSLRDRIRKETTGL